MFVRVLLLRRKGVRLDLRPDRVVSADDVGLEGGILQWGKPLDMPGTCLMLRYANSAPSIGVLQTLYDPKVTDIGHNYFKLRGFEPALEGEKSVGYLQEWAVFPMNGLTPPSLYTPNKPAPPAITQAERLPQASS